MWGTSGCNSKREEVSARWSQLNCRIERRHGSKEASWMKEMDLSGQLNPLLWRKDGDESWESQGHQICYRCQLCWPKYYDQFRLRFWCRYVLQYCLLFILGISFQKDTMIWVHTFVWTIIEKKFTFRRFCWDMSLYSTNRITTQCLCTWLWVISVEAVRE
jgi:hypothetical protein